MLSCKCVFCRKEAIEERRRIDRLTRFVNTQDNKKNKYDIFARTVFIFLHYGFICYHAQFVEFLQRQASQTSETIGYLVLSRFYQCKALISYRPQRQTVTILIRTCHILATSIRKLVYYLNLSIPFIFIL